MFPEKVFGRAAHVLLIAILVSGATLLACASFTPPKPVGVSVEKTPAGLTETCIDWARKNPALIAPRDAGSE